MIEFIVFLLLIPVLGGASYLVYTRQNRAVWLSIRDDKLLVMTKHDERSNIYKELRDQAIKADIEARNAWRADIDAFVANVQRSRTQVEGQKTNRLAIEMQMDRARVSCMQDGLREIESKVRERRDDLIERNEWTVPPELDHIVFEGKVL